MLNSSLTQLGAALRARTVSSVELTKSYLDRIATHNPAFNAYVTVDEKTSLAQALAADALLASGRAQPLTGHSDRAERHFLRKGLAHHLRLQDALRFHCTL